MDKQIKNLQYVVVDWVKVISCNLEGDVLLIAEG